jgi:hypothetical protein
MTSAGVVFAALALVVASLLYWLPRRILRQPERRDGAPRPALVRSIAAIDVGSAALLLTAGFLSHGRLVQTGPLWRHDVWSALLIGVLAGFFLHVVGGGSPLPVASLRAPRLSGDFGPLPGPGFPTAALFFAGEAASTYVWFGVGLATFIHVAPRLFVLALIALGFGFRRAASGQDHPLLGAIDGLLLAVLYQASGSLLAVVVAHLVGDVLAYVSAASDAEETEAPGEVSGLGDYLPANARRVTDP